MSEEMNLPRQEAAQDENEQVRIRKEKLAALQEAGKDPFTIVKYDVTHHSQEIKDRFEELEGKTVCVAGRMMSKRVMGKASFCHVQDLQGTIQSYVARDSLGRIPTRTSKSWTSAILSALRAWPSAPKPARFLSTPRKWRCCPRASRCCRRNTTA